MKQNAAIRKWKRIQRRKPTAYIEYVHIPKTGGTFVKSILSHTKIISISSYTKGTHARATNVKNINFTVIRHPVDRFESYMNYKYGGKVLPLDRKKTKTSLNEIFSNMSLKRLEKIKKKFFPLIYYLKNIDIIITINMLNDFLGHLGYDIDSKDYNLKNISVKKRGYLNRKNRAIIADLYKEDMNLYNNLKQRQLIYEPIN
jgi:hypothetical protein